MNLRYRARWRYLALLCGVLVIFAAGDVQAADNTWIGAAGDNNWNTDSNWDQGGAPLADPYQEVAVINDGSTVFISSPAPDPGGLDLGREEGDSGTLQILSGGSLNLVETIAAGVIGTANIGMNGDGTLEVRGGGSLSAMLLDTGDGTSLIAIGQGTGAASVQTATREDGSGGGMWLDGTMSVYGGGHTISAATFITFQGNSVYNPHVTSTGISKLSAAGVVTLDGVLKPEFDSVTPTVGSHWDLADAASVSGNFASIDLSDVPTPADGTVYRTSVVSGGANGRLLQLQYDAVLRLEVNGSTGAVSVSSPSGTPVSIIGYSILSDSGLLNMGQWDSLQDQYGGAWEEADPTTTSLNELNHDPGDSLAVGSTPISLGTPFNFAPAAFGDQPDIELEYVTDSGEIVQGQVEYAGAALNNLVLTVDPSTGEAVLKNSSSFSIDLIGYSVQSASGALLTGWNSLDDQNVDGTDVWQEANPTTTSLSELNPQSATTIGPNGSFNLGTLWDTGGLQDVALEFQLDAESESRFGAVVYGALPTGLPGDYNGDDVIDAADYTVWRDAVAAGATDLTNDPTPGTVDESDYAYWKAHFGETAGSGSLSTVGSGLVAGAPVPEPAAASLLIMGLLLFAPRRLSRRRRGG